MDVLIVGAGPTGLMMAAEMARYGLSCRLIDKGLTYRDETRAVGIQPRTMEIFGHIGIEKPFLEEGLQVSAANPMCNGERLAHISFEGLESPYPFILTLEQQKTEKHLADYAASQGIQVEKGIELVQLRQNREGIEAELVHAKTGEREQVKSRWLIGCDGAHSTVRSLVGLPFEGEAFADVFSLADVHVEWPYPHAEFHAFLNAKGVLAAIPLKEKNRFRLIFQLVRCRDLLKSNRSIPSGQISKETIPEPTLKEVEDLLKTYVGPDVKVSNPVWMANFHINSRMTGTYRKGSVFLAGDAAHIHSPIGAQGMNTGIQDAFNLAWKLAYVQQGKAPAELLDTYNLERHAVGAALLNATEKATFMATLHAPVAIWIRNWVIRILGSIPSFCRFLPRLLSQTAIQYPKSAFVVDRNPFHRGPKAGVRAPNGLLSGHDLYSLIKETKKIHVLLFCGPEKQDYSSLASQLKSDCIEVVLIEDQHMHEIYEVDRPAAYVLRPDTYIGYRSVPLDEPSLIAYCQNLGG